MSLEDFEKMTRPVKEFSSFLTNDNESYGKVKLLKTSTHNRHFLFPRARNDLGGFFSAAVDQR
jgi:hypothetical protein